MGHLILEGPGSTVQVGIPFKITVRVEGGKEGTAKVALVQDDPPGPPLGTIDVAVLSDGTGRNGKNVTINTEGLVTVKATADELGSDTLTLMVNR